MYTQCPKCETVFKLSAEVLRAAGGQVRCGRCGEVFSALTRLAEDSAGFSAGESPLDMEARADSILESVAADRIAEESATDDEEFVPPGVEIAQLEILEDDENDEEDNDDEEGEDEGAEEDEDLDRSMEFTLPPGELDRIFVESRKRAPLALVPQPAPSEADVELPPQGQSSSDFEVPEQVRRDMLAGLEQRVRPEDEVRDSGRRLGLWIGTAVVSALLLLAQVVHQNREWLVVHGPFGAGVRALYGAMGAPLPLPANLSSYQLRQWGVTGDPEANGTLRVRASILNGAAELQPYPLLRVMLADRFGKSIGARDFEPAEYVGKTAARLLKPGERVDATLEILDPGKNAEGFEIDVCLRGVDRRISCANDVAPQAKP